MEEKYLKELEDLIDYRFKEDGYISENLIESAYTKSVRLYIESQNTGKFIRRIGDNDREKAFHDEWIKINKIEPGINQGHGLLQNLFCSVNEPINERDRMIAATVIQWLGSNVGMSFLHDALSRFNQRIVDK